MKNRPLVYVIRTVLYGTGWFVNLEHYNARSYIYDTRPALTEGTSQHLSQTASYIPKQHQ